MSGSFIHSIKLIHIFSKLCDSGIGFFKLAHFIFPLRNCARLTVCSLSILLAPLLRGRNTSEWAALALVSWVYEGCWGRLVVEYWRLWRHGRLEQQCWELKVGRWSLMELMLCCREHRGLFPHQLEFSVCQSLSHSLSYTWDTWTSTVHVL